MEYSVRESRQWQVVDGGGKVVAGPFETQAEAWRWIDRHDGGIVSPSESRVEFGWNKFVNGE